MSESDQSRRRGRSVPCPRRWRVGIRLGLAGGILLANATATADRDERLWVDPCRAGEPAREDAIRSLHERIEPERIWVTEQGPTRAGRQLVRLLESAESDLLTNCLQDALADDQGPYTDADLEVMLTDAYLALRRQRAGAGMDWRDAVAGLTAGDVDDQAGSSATVRSTAALWVALARYREIADRGGWPRLGTGPAIGPNDRDPRVPALRERLVATGDLGLGAGNREGRVYEGPLVRALEGFQGRHGLEADGVVDTATREALDVSARQRARRLAINLRRMRERTIDARGPLVRVNVPAFRATLWEQGEVTFRTRAIVGQREHPTPQLETWIEAITVNPAWYVPRSIVREQLAPRFAEDAAYAERNGFQVVDTNRSITEIDWDARPAVDVRQAPGPGNELGRLKFEMPNPRRIYLHDTPKKHLFESRRRTFSAGCVRIEEPMALAARLTGIEAERIERMAASGETRTMRFGWRVPVQLVYFTAWVDGQGRVQFRRDIYGKDEL